MKILRILLLAAVVASVDRAVSQPVHTFRVKIGIDRESVDSLGGRERVIRHIEEMFRRVNRAFNYDARFRAIYDFVVDWNAFYIYDGVSADEVMKPHPDHDYLVVMDGYKSDLREVGGGWYGDTIQTVYHSRTHNDRFNSPFEPGAVDGIIHEFGHARGIPDIYAMKVDADKNPVNGRAFHAVRCIMDYPYGEVHWSDYAVHMINMAGGRNVNIDDLVAGALPERIRVEVADDRDAPVKDAAVRFYPVRWYTYSVNPEPCAVSETDRKGRCTLPVSQVFQPEKEFGLRYCNCLIEVESESVKTYGWLPLYELQNTRFDGKKCHVLQLTLKRSRALVRKFDPNR